MNVKLSENILFKRDKEGEGFLFSMEDAENRFVKISGIALTIIERLLAKNDMASIKQDILNEYNVTEEVLDKDLEDLFKKLQDVGFLIKE